MIPRTMGLAVNQLNLVVMTILASSLDSGSLAIFNLANNLQSFPVGIFGLSFAVAAFPTISALIDQPNKLRDSLTITIRQVLFLIIPVTIIILALRAQIIRVVLGSGRFDWRDTILTMRTLSYFGLSIFAQSLTAILVRVFYAHKNSATPFWISLLSAVVNIVLAWPWSRQLGVAGLALAFSVSSIINCALLWLALQRKGVLDNIAIIRGSFKMAVAAIVAWPVIFAAKQLIAPLVNMDTFWGITIQLIGAATAGLVTYLLVCLLLRCPEAKQLWQIISRKLPGGHKTVVDADEARGI